ncbi:MAG: M23 family metallopeptidase [Pseudomonadota bacterium]
MPDTGLATFGLRRDAPPELEIKEVGGSGASLVFSIAPRKDPVRRIEGMDCDKVDARSDAQKAHASRSWVKKTEAFQRFDGSARLLAGFNWPTEGRPTSPFGPVRTYEGISAVTGEPCEKTSVHRGYDIAAPIGTPIIAPAAGTVILAEDDLYYEGGTIFLDHGAGLVSVFMHMSDVDVAVGETVVLGQKLGAVGNTGRTTGPHLHWAVKWRDMGSDDRSRDRYIDPELLVELGAEIWVGPGDQADGLP